MVSHPTSVSTFPNGLHLLQIIIYDLDVIRPLTAMTLILYVASSLRSLSFVLLHVNRSLAMKKLRSHDRIGMEKEDPLQRFCVPMEHRLLLMITWRHMHPGCNTIL